MADVIRATALSGFTGLVTSLGGDGDALLRRAGVDPKTAGDYERFISYRAVCAALAVATTDRECPDFVLRLQRKQGVDVLGPLAVIIRHSETVADALTGVRRYLHTCAPADVIELHAGPRAAVFTFGIDVKQLAHREYMVEKSMATSVAAFRLMLGEDFIPLRVTMQHHGLAAPEIYRELFRCPVQFGGEANSVHLPNQVLLQRIRGSDPSALALAESYLGLTETGPQFSDHVREMTERLLRVNRASLVVVAREMAMHPRVLQRRLAETGTSFEQILDEVRSALAWNLAATSLQASQIATMLGYSEQSSYARACRRWYGESPRQLASRRRDPNSDRVA
ncbi:MAG: AraC family transcriptional regulator [Candidatus Nanopelagicales bacterium]